MNTLEMVDFEVDCAVPIPVENWERCERHCTQYRCCFSKENRCYEEKMAACDVHEACSALFDAEAANGVSSAISDDGGGMNTLEMVDFEVDCAVPIPVENWE